MSSELEEFLKQDPNAYQNFQAIKEAFRATPELEKTVHDMTTWHTGLIENQLTKYTKKMLAIFLKNPGNYTSKEYNEAKKKFIEISKASFKKDDGLRTEIGDAQLSNWLFWTAAFLAGANVDLAMYKQEEKNSYNIGIAFLLKYVSALLVVINNNNRDDTAISTVFQSQTEALMQWVEKIPPDLRK